ncbi:MAG: HP0268 family nuclease [Campylobacterota bacterium]|nr:HP0268 family nuclease [Campylobacterota bacterium]
MDILLARKELKSKPKKVNFEKLLEELAKKEEEIFYFDRENSHKDMMAIVDKFEEAGYTVHFREVKYGLSDDEYLYEIHAL